MDSATSRGRGRRLAIVLVALASAAMLLLGACGGGDKKTEDTKAASPTATKASGSGGDEVKVKLTEYKYEVPMTSFTSGKAYEIDATNAGVMEHNLHVFKKGDRDEPKAVAKIPTAELGAGKNASTTMTLPAAGDYEFVCTVPGHEQLGMKLDIKAT